MIQYFAAWYVARRVINVAMKLVIFALLVRVGLYWIEYKALPPFSLLLDDANHVWKWIESTGAVSWAQVQLQNLLGAQK